MKKALLFSAPLGFFLTASFALLGSPVDTYWPLNDGDSKHFVNDDDRVYRENVTDHGGGEFRVSWEMDHDSGSQIQEQLASGVYLASEDDWDSIDFDPAILLVNDLLLQNGGSITTRTTVRDNIDYDAKYTVKISKAGNVRVRSGVYLDCRNITVSEKILEPLWDIHVGNVLEAVLAPQVGIIKRRINGRWFELSSGTVNGADVRSYAAAKSTAMVQVIGNGLTSPDYNGKALLVGASYSVTAKPAKGYLFSNWADANGTVLGTDAVFRFVMQSNYVLQAVFVPTPFLAVKGNYAGLFYNSGATAQISSGALSGSITDLGRFTAKITAGDGHVYPLSGAFLLDGSYSGAITRKGMSSLVVRLQLDLNGGGPLTGSISDGTWTSAIEAWSAPYSATNHSPQAGKKYTLAIDGGEDCTVQPGGFGYGTVTVGSLGNITFAGTLGDGTAVKQSAVLCGNNFWALCLPLYSGKGLMMGWLLFNDASDSDIRGQLSWIKQPSRTGNLYTNGFAFTKWTQAFGSEYSAQNVRDWTNGTLILNGGNTGASFTNALPLAMNGRAIGTNKLSLSLNGGTGTFHGSIVHLASGKPVPFNGVYLQKQRAGYGTFLGRTETGSIQFEAAP